ncbi:Glycerophosphodiester phosphodiesterase GDE1 [Tolypocladium ophioglossoides CBS 100239]|uniref:Glycerophosphodiester phosphodiesterase GDE1 n=1 Tax=Tolypocladium ophioglossoides (strain CBS 100239) TaxID=1163406 RepID=A0A0L0N3N8_TOLOC|nr:Glycerophosphodiester phosphodiesterase GDE1 [Tolypocladium ophioglossoides CBS 100239]
MKFGQDLHWHIVPEWEQHYVHYNALKRLIKSSSGADSQASISGQLEAYRCLDGDISALDTFRQSQAHSLCRSEESLRSRFNISYQPSESLQVHGVDHGELTVLLNAFKGLERDLAKLQWFDRVNEDALDKTFGRLDRLGQKNGSPYHDLQHRWLRTRATMDESSDRISKRLRAQVATIRQELAMPTSNGIKSLLLCVHLSSPHALSSAIGAMHRSLPNHEPTSTMTRFDSLGHELGMTRQKLQAFMREDLMHSMLFRPGGLTALHLQSPLLKDGQIIDHNFLNTFIIFVGQENQTAFGIQNPASADMFHDNDPANLFRQLRDFLGPCAETVFTETDQSGRLPLHYAAKFGLVEICQVILDTLLQSQNRNLARTAALPLDSENQSPMHLAASGNHVAVAVAILNALDSNGTADSNRENTSFIGDILMVALRRQNNELVHRLLEYGTELSHQSSRGETALHVAAQLGCFGYAERILRDMLAKRVGIDVQEQSRGWTPLFTACARGHEEIAKLLLEAGASQRKTDFSGWTAKEHAAFRGHLAVAELLDDFATIGASRGPGDSSVASGDDLKTDERRGECALVVNLGSTQKGREGTAVDLDFCSSCPTQGTYRDRFYTLEVSVLGAAQEPKLIRLPVLKDMVNEPFVFSVNPDVELQLVLRVLQRRSSSQEKEGKLVASGTALLTGSQYHFGDERQSLVREQTVVILDQETMGMVGKVTLTSFICKPFEGLQAPRSIGPLEDNGETPVLVGHRGLGQNTTSRGHLQIGENTVEVYDSANACSATEADFRYGYTRLPENYTSANIVDVQITRDLEPIIYHDFSLSETGTDVAIHDLTLDQYKYASQVQSPHGNPASVVGKVQGWQHPYGGRHRSRSLGRGFEAEAIQIQDRMKHTVDFKAKGFKPNTRGDVIQDSLATLEEMLVGLPEEVGFDIEAKYPRLHEAVGAGVTTVGIDMNTFVDAILAKLDRLGGERRIMLTSFTPEICILLAWKQRAYPVMFITNAGKLPAADLEVRAASLQVAVHFAKRWNLAGVVFACETLLLCPRLVQFVKGAGLVCASYGLLNNIPDNSKMQAMAGVDIIVADRVGLIAKTLKET